MARQPTSGRIGGSTRGGRSQLRGSLSSVGGRNDNRGGQERSASASAGRGNEAGRLPGRSSEVRGRGGGRSVTDRSSSGGRARGHGAGRGAGRGGVLGAVRGGGRGRSAGGRIANGQTTESTGEREAPQPWKTSSAKAKLTALFKDPSSWVQICDFDQIYDGDVAFQQYTRQNFKTNARNLKEKIEADRLAVAFDRMALTADKALYPTKAITDRGEPRYEGSEIERFLKEDVDQGRTDNLSPLQVWGSRPTVYKNMSLSCFRSHLHRERRKKKESVYWQKKRNDKGKKKQIVEENSAKEDATDGVGIQNENASAEV